MSKSLLLLSSLVLAACMPGPSVSVMRTGPAYPPKPEDCQIRFEQLTFTQADATHDQVGLVTITGSSDDAFSQDNQEAVRAQACALGGDMATVNGTGATGASSMVQFAIWRKTAESTNL